MALTVDRLRALLRYDQDTGLFVWKVGYVFKVETPAGSVNGQGYNQIRIDRISYRGGRLAWLYMTGKWPVGDIDHIDGNRSNDRWSNLREATTSQNIANSRLSRRNSIGLKGVSKSGNHWRARIKIGGESKHLGLFKVPEEAHRAYLKQPVAYSENLQELNDLS